MGSEVGVGVAKGSVVTTGAGGKVGVTVADGVGVGLATIQVGAVAVGAGDRGADGVGVGVGVVVPAPEGGAFVTSGWSVMQAARRRGNRSITPRKIE